MAKPVYALVNGAWVLVGSTTAHNHTITDITGLQAALDDKANAADVTTALADKADIASPTFTGTLTANTVKITGGVPGAGKVLTSDADGDATWEVVSGSAPLVQPDAPSTLLPEGTLWIDEDAPVEIVSTTNVNSISMVEQALTPDTPSAGEARVYVGSDGKLRSVDDGGVVTAYGAGPDISSDQAILASQIFS